MINTPLRIKLLLVFLLMVFASSVLMAQSKVKVYHCSANGEICDKIVAPDDLKKIQEAIKAWEAFDYKKVLFETFLPVSKTKDWNEIAPKPGTAGDRKSVV